MADGARRRHHKYGHGRTGKAVLGLRRDHDHILTLAASTRSHGYWGTGLGQCGSLLQSCEGLSSHTSCQFGLADAEIGAPTGLSPPRAFVLANPAVWAKAGSECSAARKAGGLLAILKRFVRPRTFFRLYAFDPIAFEAVVSY